jgi:sulfur carrier protein ThiS adenylyltransferase
MFGLCRVGIAGAGGLGSQCAITLARAGVGQLVLADFDVVSTTNLDRQHYFLDQVGRPKVNALMENIARIDPSIHVESHEVRLDPESIPRIFSSCQVIVEAFDDPSEKTMIIETVLEKMPLAWIVAASGLAGIGSLSRLKTIRSGRFIICGDFENEVSDDNPPVAARVAIVANMEADAVLEILLGLQPALARK